MPAKPIKELLFRTGLLKYISETKNRARHLLKAGYKPKSFWDGWADTFTGQRFQQGIHAGQERILEKIRSLGPKSILEVGCGFGRNLNFLYDRIAGESRISITGVDISENLLKKAGSLTGSREIELMCADIDRLPFLDDTFDLVFTHGTLMHIPADMVKSAIKELARVSGKDVLCVEEVYWEDMPSDKATISPNRYTFYHDYARILKDAGLENAQFEYIEGRIRYVMFHYRKMR